LSADFGDYPSKIMATSAAHAVAPTASTVDQKELVNTLYESFRKDFQVFVSSYIVNVTTKIKSKYPLAQVEEDLKKLFKEAGFADDVVTSVSTTRKRTVKPKKDNPDAKQCTALKANKQPCSKNATPGSVYCKLHKNKIEGTTAVKANGTAAAPAAAKKKKATATTAESKKVAKIEKEESDDDDEAAVSDADEEDK